MNRQTTSMRPGLWLVGWFLALSGCVATPLPTPPTASPSQMTLIDRQPGEVDLIGAAGALEGDGIDGLRVTGASGSVQTTVAADGSFEARSIPSASRGDTFYLEAITADDDVFVLAITGGPASSAMASAPGTDTDEDGSPDAIDCAPEDASLAGQRCRCGAVEFCSNGIDDNCDGMVDEPVCNAGCTESAECPAGQQCVDAVCVAM